MVISSLNFNPLYGFSIYFGKYIFWGGLTIASESEGVGLFNQELSAYLSLGGKIHYETAAKDLIFKNNKEVYRSIGEISKEKIYKAIESSI